MDKMGIMGTRPEMQEINKIQGYFWATKKRIYLKPGEKAPEGANVQQGTRGGQFYESGAEGGKESEYPGERITPGNIIPQREGKPINPSTGKPYSPTSEELGGKKPEKQLSSKAIQNIIDLTEEGLMPEEIGAELGRKDINPDIVNSIIEMSDNGLDADEITENLKNSLKKPSDSEQTEEENNDEKSEQETFGNNPAVSDTRFRGLGTQEHGIKPSKRPKEEDQSDEEMEDGEKEPSYQAKEIKAAQNAINEFGREKAIKYYKHLLQNNDFEKNAGAKRSFENQLNYVKNHTR